MPAHNRKLKFITFTLDGTDYQCQVQTWNIANNTDDGEKFYSFCTDGTTFDEADTEFREEADDDYALEVTFFADWRSAGISDFLWANDQTNVTFQLDHHPDIAAEHVRWNGTVKIKAPSVGGDVRTTEMTEVTLPIIGKPTFTRVGS